MKNLFILLSFFALSGCDKSVDDFNFNSRINGQIVTWNPANSDTLLWRIVTDSVNYVLINTRISESGHFNLNLPVPPPAVLHNFTKIEIHNTAFDIVDLIHFSDTTAKYIQLSLEHYQHIPFPLVCGNTNSINANSAASDYQIQYYWFDKPAVVDGSWIVNIHEGYYPEYARTIKTVYNKVKFFWGWNQVIMKLISSADNERIYEVSKEEREDTEWRISPVPNEFVRFL